MTRSRSAEQDKLDPRGDEADAAEARRQSLLVAEQPSEMDALRFVADAADESGWN